LRSRSNRIKGTRFLARGDFLNMMSDLLKGGASSRRKEEVSGKNGFNQLQSRRTWPLRLDSLRAFAAALLVGTAENSWLGVYVARYSNFSS
jgi:hypothetical protein